MKTTELHPIFAECCASEAGSVYDNTRPFVRAGYCYATDERIIVRCPAGDEPDSTDAIRRRDPTALNWRRSNMNPCELPDAPEKRTKCSACNGERREFFTECPECCGDGICSCHCGDEHDCGHCRGKGSVYHKGVCDECSGDGDHWKMYPVRLTGGHHMSDRYVRLLKKYGAQVSAPKHPDKPFRFQIPGTDIEGLVMPVNPQGVA